MKTQLCGEATTKSSIKEVSTKGDYTIQLMISKCISSPNTSSDHGLQKLEAGFSSSAIIFEDLNSGGTKLGSCCRGKNNLEEINVAKEGSHLNLNSI
jgi:hypothetical protein